MNSPCPKKKVTSESGDSQCSFVCMIDVYLLLCPPLGIRIELILKHFTFRRIYIVKEESERRGFRYLKTISRNRHFYVVCDRERYEKPLKSDSLEWYQKWQIVQENQTFLISADIYAVHRVACKI
jgi:hypothetical protein